MRKPAVFIDRDGTLNEMVFDATHGLLDSPHRPEDVRLRPGAADFLCSMREAGYFLCVATNQPGMAKGYMTQENLDAVNNRLAELLAAKGAKWDELRICPHHPGGVGVAKGALVRFCRCRKPAPGLLLEAAAQHEIELAASWMVGDGINDVQAGRAAGCRSVLVTSLKLEQIERFLNMENAEPDAVVANLLEAAEYILNAPPVCKRK